VLEVGNEGQVGGGKDGCGFDEVVIFGLNQPVLLRIFKFGRFLIILRSANQIPI
jgi:hypothetical protein